MSKRFIFTLLTMLIIGLIATVAILAAKGFRPSGEKGKFFVGTGILSITSVPDQASIYLDGHLTSATNTNVNSLPAKKYQVRIVKEGYIPWEKEVEVKEGFVSQVKATLFKAYPSIYPLTNNGATKTLLSSDGQKLVFVVPVSDGNLNNLSPVELKRSGIWVWTMGEKPITFARGGEPHQIAQVLPGVDYSKANFRFSPDSTQLLVQLPDRSLLLDTTRFNDPPRDVTAIVGPTLAGWDEEQKTKDLTRLQLIKDLNVRKVASSAAVLKWAPDESKILYSTDGKKDFKVVVLTQENGVPVTNTRTYDLPQSPSYSWLPGSNHLLTVETAEPIPTPDPKKDNGKTSFPLSKITILEFDGRNKAEIYAGNFDPSAVYAWPDGSRVVVIHSFQTAYASQPNLYGINLK